MIVTFQSKASGDVIMFGDVAHRMMELMGKEVGDQGIVTVAQLPAALASLKAAIGQETEYVKALTGSGKPFAQGPSRGPDAGKAMTEAEYAAAMRAFRERHEREPMLVDRFDLGGCSCMEEPETLPNLAAE